MTLLEELEKATVKYSPTIVRDLINSNRKRYGCVQPRTKKILYFMMRRIVVRGAITFMNINKNRNNDTYYSVEDILQELYFTLHHCSDLFDTALGKDFYLYYNSSVSRRINRMSNYKRVNNREMCFTRLENDDDDRSFDDMFVDKFIRYDFSENMFWEDVQNLGFSYQEQGLIKSIYNSEKIKSVCEENNITRAEYNKAITNFKTVFKEYRE